MSTVMKYITQIISQLMGFLGFLRKNSNKKEQNLQKEEVKKSEEVIKKIIKQKDIDVINVKFGWKD